MRNLLVCLSLTFSSYLAYADILGAVHSQDLEAIRICIAMGEDVNVRDENQLTPLLLASSYGNFEAVHILLNAGAHVDAQTNLKANSSLLIALRGGYLPIADALLAKGADIELRNSASLTPLMFAAFWGRFEFVKKLVAKGANINAATRKGKSALDGAEERAHTDIAQFLILSGAEIKGETLIGKLTILLGENPLDYRERVVSEYLDYQLFRQVRVALFAGDGDDRRNLPIELIRNGGVGSYFDPQPEWKYISEALIAKYLGARYPQNTLLSY